MKYIEKINKLVPIAVRAANQKIKTKDTSGMSQLEKDDLWNRIYHREMDVLAADAGLRAISSAQREEITS
ncbi:MAG: hypothetical protein ACOC4Y_00860 [bacterium]